MRSSKELTPSQKDQLYSYQSYFRYMISNPLHKSFDDHSGHIIEIYHIENTYSDYHSDTNNDINYYEFTNSWGEIEFDYPDLLTGNLTIDMLVFMNFYPETWTPLISKIASDQSNEFNFRIRDRTVGQWYYGNGENPIILTWRPETALPLGRWVRLTAVRDIDNGMQQLFLNGREISRRHYENLNHAANTDASIYIMGNRSRTLPGKLSYLRIWNTSFDKSTLIMMDEALESSKKIPGLIGYWKFDHVGEEGIIVDLSGNENHIFIKNR